MSSEQSIAVNGRYQVHRITGVQRYAHEIVSRLGPSVDVLAPSRGKGAVGHLWEQTALPVACGGRLLWSPGGAGPAFYPRQVVTFHDLFPLEHPEWYSPAYGRWYRFLMTQLAKRALHLIAVSEYTKSRLVAVLGCDPARVSVISNGPTTGCARVGEEQVGASRVALKLPTRRYVLSLSSLESRKNLRTILEAWRLVHADLPADVWLVLAGPKADEAVYAKQQLATDLPRVYFTGYVPEMHLAGLYSGASVFLFPSLAEGFGLPLLEAMACGLRAVTSNTSSLPEVGGDAVAYVDPLEAPAIARALQDQLLLAGPSAGPFLPAIERAKRFSWDDAAARTRATLEAVAATVPGAAVEYQPGRETV